MTTDELATIQTRCIAGICNLADMQVLIDAVKQQAISNDLLQKQLDAVKYYVSLYQVSVNSTII